MKRVSRYFSGGVKEQEGSWKNKIMGRRRSRRSKRSCGGVRLGAGEGVGGARGKRKGEGLYD